ncbi:hypothetical protein GALMADRAFT_54086 [Galerina marginata CBS 339.88]|uniref:Ima1 N-terminal domain-containing protein n=1 Tax=Galerina marginata (strain CBS 339.88) TaxID=685588 RepID=A0A067TQ67_GALM3|nr:hypothetical protein GALMADRAFT_54086 [Galerina marginata CBS 339.88]
MPALFRRQSNIQCFFCRSPIHIPVNLRNFKCPSCACWNRYDEKGEIISDEPAMHEEAMNSRSFAKRASPSKDRLPTLYGPGPFCHSCQTNQMLIINLLSNYLPAPEDPEYESRLEMLPAYRESLHVRYPPVCESCLPQVEEEIRRKEQMARVKALGGWLSKGKERRRRVSAGPDVLEREATPSETIFWWKARGCLWAATLCVSMIGTFSAAYGYHPFSRLSFIHPILPLLVGISLLWTAWDPTFASFRKAQLQGRDVRIHGKRTYNMLQILAWSVRMCSSIILSVRRLRPDIHIFQLKNRVYLLTAFSIELITVVSSYYVLRVQQPPSIRLVDTHAHRFDKSRSGTPNPDSRGTTPTASKFPSLEPDALLSLSLSSKPVISRTKPVFGLPSLQGTIRPLVPKQETNDDEMDWTPTNPDATPYSSNRVPPDGDNNWLRPQRFFAPEKPTGLEGLFESTRIQDEPMPFHDDRQVNASMSLSRMFTNHLRKWAPLYTLFLGILVASVGYTMKWHGLMHWAS